jgi:outer membrane lipoprotein carrier protein
MKFVVSLLLTLLVSSAHAGGVEVLRQFVETTHSLRADFSQTVVAKNGRKPQQSSGSMAFQRPGKLRWQIDKPYVQLMVGDGSRFWIHDPELQQVTVKKAVQALGSTPAALLAGSNDLDRNFVLKDLPDAESLVWVEATPRSQDSGFERMRVGFRDGQLLEMQIIDSFGQTTYLMFSRVDRNPSLPASLFHFTPPPGADVIGE